MATSDELPERPGSVPGHSQKVLRGVREGQLCDCEGVVGQGLHLAPDSGVPYQDGCKLLLRSL